LRLLLWLSSGKKTLWLILALGCLVRIVMLCNLAVINPDGILYIEQAKAIASGQWDFLTHYELPYVSLYPFLIACVHLVVPSWIACGQLVSLFFGCGLLVLLYPLARRFFSKTISQLALLLFALTPLLVRYSVDVMRDSTAWFMYCASVLVFLESEGLQGKKTQYAAAIISAFVLAFLAAWCRIETVILLPVFCIYLSLNLIRTRLRLIFTVVLPLSLLLLVVWVFGDVISSFDLLKIVRLNEVAEKIYEPIRSYGLLRSKLDPIALSYGFSPIGNFLTDAYHVVWSMPFAVILSNVVEAFFPPYFPLYVLGIAEMAKWRMWNTPLVLFWLLLVFGFVVLYFHVLETWVMTYRFAALLLFPSLIIAASGIERCLRWLHPRLGQRWAVIALVAWLVVFSLGKNMRPIEADKKVYPAIAARSVALAEKGTHAVFIAGLNTVAHRWVSFYAAARLDEPIGHTQLVVRPSSMKHLVALMREKKMEFMLWEQRAWKRYPFGRSPASFLKQFTPVGEWSHDDTGKLILFRLKK